MKHVNVHRIRVGFDQTQMKGRPIMVAASPADQLYLIEGYSRCSVMLQGYWAAQLPAQGRVTVFVGITPRLPEWNWY
jgi:hypothetical protein